MRCAPSHIQSKDSRLNGINSNGLCIFCHASLQHVRTAGRTSYDEICHSILFPFEFKRSLQIDIKVPFLSNTKGKTYTEFFILMWVSFIFLLRANDKKSFQVIEDAFIQFQRATLACS